MFFSFAQSVLLLKGWTMWIPIKKPHCKSGRHDSFIFFVQFRCCCVCAPIQVTTFIRAKTTNVHTNNKKHTHTHSHLCTHSLWETCTTFYIMVAIRRNTFILCTCACVCECESRNVLLLLLLHRTHVTYWWKVYELEQFWHVIHTYTIPHALKSIHMYVPL